MDAAVCFSGGKDSALAALLLEDFYDVTLVTATVGVTADFEHAEEAAAELGFDFETAKLDRKVADEAVDRMLDDGFPRNGIQMVHEHAVETIAASGAWDAVVDGTRRDDRVPKLDRSAARSVEDRFEVSYVAPLTGIGRGAIDAMVDGRLRIETGPSEELAKSDYESELRELIVERAGADVVGEIFPEHTQSRVLGRLD